MKLLEKKNAIVTGGSDGIGYEIAKALAQNGANLLLIGRNEEKLCKAALSLSNTGVQVETLSYDLSCLLSFSELSGKIANIFLEIDILVNNAGVAKFSSFETVSMQEIDYSFDLNVKALFLLTQALLPSLKRNQASIINISSFHAFRVMPGIFSTVYSMTKGAVNAFTKALAYELGPFGIRVNAIAPGNVRTAKVQAYVNNLPGDKRETFNEFVRTNYPLGRFGNLEELGGIAVYLASAQASWVTGSIFNIDGGLTTN
ncbi:SDR family NAD(P)-dependent oxidoreductase [Sporomusa acidovorans]|uniref:Gluconate 5-dehydrogenase n=1 Tax=Sporomusa acidovorans (strain ATCC 49682 / DSM 3132 / Mol) TaxID=1123286 RepID=A0ABZ3IYK7_SPOA4|nr:SDR family oxidoreductase [Sporomusa acidovorans]OZC16940.1 gluconate 5-dehydrogenase [Sporomusa acidovorans DSM 3132]SDE13312.1 Short-chain dehydrogenase [Sporomusa acidovorans]